MRSSVARLGGVPSVKRAGTRRGCGALSAVVDPHEVAAFMPHLPSTETAQWLLSSLQGVYDSDKVEVGKGTCSMICRQG